MAIHIFLSVLILLLCNQVDVIIFLVRRVDFVRHFLIELVVRESVYHVIGLKTPSLWVTLTSIPGLHDDTLWSNLFTQMTLEINFLGKISAFLEPILAILVKHKPGSTVTHTAALCCCWAELKFVVAGRKLRAKSHNLFWLDYILVFTKKLCKKNQD